MGRIRRVASAIRWLNFDFSSGRSVCIRLRAFPNHFMFLSAASRRLTSSTTFHIHPIITPDSCNLLGSFFFTNHPLFTAILQNSRRGVFPNSVNHNSWLTRECNHMLQNVMGPGTPPVDPRLASAVTGHMRAPLPG